jgi:hypothetical protein
VNPETEDADMFSEVFAHAQVDGQLAASVDVARLSRLAQILASDDVRHWASGCFDNRSFADVVTSDLAALIARFNTVNQ